jgi:biopolymer transport protein ExbD
MARSRGTRLEEKFPEPELLPIMNIIFMLILALVSMAALLPLGVLSSEAQKLSKGIGGAAELDQKKPLNLIVFITEAGFNVSVRGEVKMGGADPSNPARKLPLIPVIQNGNVVEYDYQALQKKLVEFKAIDREEESMTITADPEVKFDAVIQTMDASRFDNEKKLLFPKVSFAAGIVG